MNDFDAEIGQQHGAHLFSVNAFRNDDAEDVVHLVADVAKGLEPMAVMPASMASPFSLCLATALSRFLAEYAGAFACAVKGCGRSVWWLRRSGPQ